MNIKTVNIKYMMRRIIEKEIYLKKSNKRKLIIRKIGQLKETLNTLKD